MIFKGFSQNIMFEWIFMNTELSKFAYLNTNLQDLV